MKLLVLGGGESGVGAALLGKKLGYEILVSDFSLIKPKYKDVLSKSKILWEEATHEQALAFGPDLVVKSPGIPEKAPVVSHLRKQGCTIVSEIEFASSLSKAKLIAITGTNGKTTTSNLVYHILKKAGLDVVLAGNVGRSFAAELAISDRDFFVLEVSSFQLDDIDRFTPFIAILLNITPDHLDRYDNDLTKYIDSKLRITENQSAAEHLIYCYDDEIVKTAVESYSPQAELHPFSIFREVNNGAYLDNDQLKVNLTNKSFEMSIHELALQGKHNTYNSMAASIAARILDIRKELVRESLCDFQNIEHRLEFVAKVHGINFINDSKATNVNSTWYALESISDPIVWIVGGVDKGNDYSMLEPLVREKVKAIVCLGKDNRKLIDFFSPMVPTIVEASSADEAVAFGYRLGNKGDVVLLSPACASFDLFENYEDRGHQFKRAIRAL